jgi:hypothetical protein
VLLVFCRRLDTAVEFLTNKEDLAVLVVKILGFDFGPC